MLFQKVAFDPLDIKGKQNLGRRSSMRSLFQWDLEHISYDELMQKGKGQLIENVLDEDIGLQKCSDKQ